MRSNVREFNSFADASAFIREIFPGEEMRISFQYVNDQEVWTVEHLCPAGDPVALEQDRRRFRAICNRGG